MFCNKTKTAIFISMVFFVLFAGCTGQENKFPSQFENSAGSGNNIEAKNGMFLVNGCAKLDKPSAKYVLEKDINSGTDLVCLQIEADSIILDCKNHKITGKNLIDSIGVFLQSEKSAIRNCEITNWHNGIKLLNSKNSTVKGNILNSNNNGIFLERSKNNQVNGNKIYSNKSHGIFLLYSSLNKILENSVQSNASDGILFDYSSENFLSENFVCGNGNSDIANNGEGNSGRGNTCLWKEYWNDEDQTGCTAKCQA